MAIQNVGSVSAEWTGAGIVAGLKARGVFPVKKVFNELTVKGKGPEPGTGAPRRTKAGVYIADAF